MYAHSHTCVSRMLVVIRVFGRCSMYLTSVDVVGGLLVTSSRHLSVLVYLCNKLVIVVAIAFVYCPLR